ncbi:MAG: AsmA family protein, partial [Lautropia sp.]
MTSGKSSGASIERMRRRRTRMARWLLPLLLLLFLIVSELSGWAYLRRPVAAWLSSQLQREVEIGAPFRIHLRKTIPVRLGSLLIGAPDWSGQPHFLDATSLYAEVNWDVLVGARARFRRLDVDRADLRLERDADGRTTWSLRSPDETRDGSGRGKPIIERLAVGDAKITVADAKQDLRLEIQASSRVAAVAPEGTDVPGEDPEAAGLSARGRGVWKGDPLSFELHSRDAVQWREDNDPTILALRVKLKETEASFDGSIAQITSLQQVSGDVSLRGPTLGDLTAIPGLTLPETPSYRIEGRVQRDGHSFRFDLSRADIGSSRLSARLEYDAEQTPPLLKGSIAASRLVLQDLGPTIGTGAKRRGTAGPAGKERKGAGGPPGRVLPSGRFDLPPMRTMNADLALDFDKLDLGTDALRPLQSVKSKLSLQGGVLTLKDLQASLAGGPLGGSTILDGSAPDRPPEFEAHLRWQRVDLANWLKPSVGAKLLAGRFHGETSLKGRGNSTAAILESLSGSLKGRVEEGSVSHQFVEIAGLDVAQALGVFAAGDKPLPLSCALMDLAVAQGKVEPRLFLLNTRDTLFFLQGKVDLSNEKLDLRLVQSPKDWSPFSLRSPITIRGTL